MLVIPAIDLRDGKCVRLIQGEYHRQITYQDDPVQQALAFKTDGAKWLHVVDLDGAKVGKSINTDTIREIKAESGLKVEVGGGIRDEDTIRQMLDMGIDRVIIGTQAVKEFNWFSEMANKFPQKLILSLDTRGSKVAIAGWTQDTPQQLWDFASQAAALPLGAIIYTDISKDGMMDGPNFERTKALADAVNVDVYAAGGVTSVEDVRQFADIGIAGVIIGRSLYENNIKLKEAIRVVREVEQQSS